jgi:dTDP-glucose 4,6-dehydratase
LITSSGAIYGKQPESVKQIKETDHFTIDIYNTVSAYAEGKRMAELYGSIYSVQFNLPVKIARCFAFVGPFLPLEKHFAIGNFILNSIKEEKIIIKGDGTSIRSYLYASDLMIWLFTILLKGRINYPYNVGSEEEVSIAYLAELVCKYTNHGYGYEIQTEKGIESIIDRYIPSTLRAREELNLSQTVNIADAIKKTFYYYKNQNS